MSAVSSESPLADADLSEPSANPSTPGASAAQPPGADFGANEWLVDELYQRYLADPGSVDRAWWSFFSDYRPTRGNGTGSHPAMPNGTPAETVNAASPPASTSAPAAQAAPAAPAATAPSAASAPAAPASSAPSKPSQPSQPSQPQVAPPPSDADLSRLRGAAARTAQNMAASLSVPTATSVRAVPAKLLIDNRIVVNNHLQRGKGGKVSFTHLIGYAVVQALRANPEMNAAYAEEDGKPVLAVPHHVNLGLAIDLRAKDGSRLLLVPNIMGAG
jgi:multifunctional 2-oxoglutarate metabolism enzyme